MALYELDDDQRNALLTIINIALVNPIHGGMNIAEPAVVLSKILQAPLTPPAPASEEPPA